MFFYVKQIVDFDVMIQKENLDDQEKNIKINDLKLRSTDCGGEISSRIFHDQANMNWEILDNIAAEKCQQEVSVIQ